MSYEVKLCSCEMPEEWVWKVRVVAKIGFDFSGAFFIISSSI